MVSFLKVLKMPFSTEIFITQVTMPAGPIHIKTVVSFLVVLKMPFFNENLYYTACDSGGIQIKNIVVSFLVVLKMPFSIEIFIAQLTMLDAFT